MPSSDIVIEEEIQTRVRLYDFSTGSQTFFQWQAGMLPAKESIRVLELGAGNGALWEALLFRWPNCDITLTDIDADVLKTAQEKLAPFESNAESVTYQTLDFNNLPFEDNSFDVVVANHNLYYAQDVDSVIASIQNILKPGGQLISSTIGKDHLHELIAMIREQGASLPWGAEEWAASFGLENGAQVLMNHFEHVDQFEYDNNLHVNAVEPVVAYLKRAMKGSLTEWVAANEGSIQASLEAAMAQKGYLRLTPHSGFFIAYKAD